MATVLEVLTTGERADLIIDQLVAFGRSELEQQRVMIRVRIHEQSPWWLPKFVDQEIFDKLVGGLEELLDAIAADPAHPARREIKARLESLQHAMAADPALAAKSRALKEELVAHPGRAQLRVRALAAAAQRARGGAGGRGFAARARPAARDRARSARACARTRR